MNAGGGARRTSASEAVSTVRPGERLFVRSARHRAYVRLIRSLAATPTVCWTAGARRITSPSAAGESASSGEGVVAATVAVRA